jgi:hypothetical protein
MCPKEDGNLCGKVSEETTQAIVRNNSLKDKAESEALERRKRRVRKKDVMTAMIHVLC